MPTSWLNSEDFLESAVIAFEPERVNWDAICATYKKLGVWSKHAPGNSPGTESCLCPHEILIKHGIVVFEAGNDLPVHTPALRAM